MSEWGNVEEINREDKETWFEAVMDEYGEKLTKLAYNYLKDWSLAEDVVQDVFVISFKQFENLKNILSLKAWIYRITINKCKDVLKSSTVKRVITNPIFFLHTKSTGLSPEMSLIKSSEEYFLSTCVLALPVKYQEVITLYYYEELSIEEISGILKINKNTVKTRLSRARMKLEKLMERWR
ncbi:sigma-70 family RNA polymerase sigma factor [Caldibacillus lycopersici]|uniref:RNA polymerase sigma factor n=1 Tax=Perspicuibacillus lycopersici TaxID=1325689 RepID=A0AAE3IYV6_9BACI|nr:sigma-70 family RNA polymerase sigma factor [Perspicuibacillus lycopersici]MCU9614580.1 sigma-70 family RNA polymerase sigma factor [Perspicuibacillus lycopersici]